MFYFLCKSILYRRNLVQNINPNAYHNTLRWVSNEPNQHSFTVSYLINSLGFSQKAALCASKYVRFKTRHKPDEAIEFLKGFGFTQTQIARLVRSFPRILTMRTQKTILPKLEFLESKGISRPDLLKSLSLYPTVLQSDLGLIKARYEFLFGFTICDVSVAKTIRGNPDVLVNGPLRQNISILQEHKVPNSNIAIGLARQPFCFLKNPGRFREIVEKAAALGFDASKMIFVDAVSALCSLTKSNWDAKVDLYKKWGWSHQEVLQAFKRQPKCMLVSQEKISACMDFLTNRMGWASQIVVKCPLVVSMSLEKRVIPRCLVYRLLQSRGLLKRTFGLNSLLGRTEENFLKKFVTPYEDKCPEILKFFEEKMKHSNGSSSEND